MGKFSGGWVVTKILIVATLVLGITGCLGSTNTSIEDGGPAAANPGDFKLTAITPASTDVSADSTALTLTGSGFSADDMLIVIDPSQTQRVVSVTYLSDSTLTYAFDARGMAGIWTFYVLATDGTRTNSLTVAVSSKSPEISEITPNSVSISNNPVALTFIGSYFQDGASVVATAPDGASSTITEGVARFSRTAMTVSFDNGGQAGVWSFSIKNPDGRSSNAAQVQVITGAPQITQAFPLPAVASQTPVMMTLRGNNFVSGSTLRVTAPSGAEVTLDSTAVDVRSSSTIEFLFDNAQQTGDWSFVVVSPDSKLSNSFTVPVVLASEALPTILAVSPSEIAASAVEQTITVTGANFSSGAVLIFTDPDGNELNNAGTAMAASTTTLVYGLLNDRKVGTWKVRVKNADGTQSADFAFEVFLKRRIVSIQKGTAAFVTEQVKAAMTSALPGDTIAFDCGFYEINSTFQLSGTEDIWITGCGIDKTVLSFANSPTPEGILADHVRGLIVRDLTVADSDGNGFELRSVDWAKLERVRAFWSSGGGRHSADRISASNFNDGRLKVACTAPPTHNPNVPENQDNPAAVTTSPDYTPSDKAGRYGIYPVKSKNIHVVDSESIGASDAGIYIGQSSNSIIESSRAAYNVFGFEIENVQGGEYVNNLAECNTGGFLVYDLDGNLTQYGDRSRMYGNLSRMNNTYNFTEGGFVANVPPGSGMITLSYDRIDVFENTFRDNNTGGIIHVSYELFPEGAGRPTEKRIDFYTEGVHIFNNNFINNGNNLPTPTTEDIENQDLARFLPTLVGAKVQAGCADPRNLANGDACPLDGKGGYRGAHILWDGLEDPYDADCPYPKRGDGTNVPMDERGKPLHTNQDPDYGCHYNGYKFDTITKERIKPDWWFSCIDDDNHFSTDSVRFANFNGLKGLDAAIIAATAGPEALFSEEAATTIAMSVPAFPANFDLAPHKCETAYGVNLDLLPPVIIPEFVPSGDIDPAPSDEEIAQLCDAPVGVGEVNFAAAKVNCPDLSQYNLFEDAGDPTSLPNGNGVPFVLNSKLFTDYAVKYRVAYLPPGTQATYRAADGNENERNSTIVFPVGTIIAKTFSFLKDGVETPAETRLIIKRKSSSGLERWAGLPYVWGERDGQRIATLQSAGATISASWSYTDHETGSDHSGQTDNYLVPNANQCVSCHFNEDAEAGGVAPIGPKVRNLNRPYASESTITTGQSAHPIFGVNQIEYLCANGFLTNCPTDLGIDTNGIAQNLERIPKFNVPGDSGSPADSEADIEDRARAWLEINCAHCHNDRGFAANTGMYLDSIRAVDRGFGVCKGPTAAGAAGTGGRTVDIHPGDSAKSIVEFRISPAATSPSAMMPPIGRSQVDTEGHALIKRWIDDVIKADDSKYPNSTDCAGG